MTELRKGVLEGRTPAVAVFILFSCLSAWSWASMSKSHLAHDPVYIAGLLFALFIMVSVAYRSPLLEDRIAFNAAAIAFLCAAVLAIAPLGPAAMLVVMAAKSMMWTVTAAVGFVVLVRGSKGLRGNG